MRGVDLCWLLLTLSSAAAADAAPGIATLDYHAGDIISVHGRAGYALDLEFQAGERVINIAAGNLALVELGVEGNHAFVKPRRPSGRTDLIVLTDRRTYRFDYRVEPEVGRPGEGLTYAIAFSYPDPRAGQPAPDAQPPRTWRADYWFCGAAALRPLEAFDDGDRTYLRFASEAELPVVYAVDPDGEERLVNSHVAQDWLIVHETPPHIALRLGRLAGCVERRSGSGASRRAVPPADGGTTAAVQP